MTLVVTSPAARTALTTLESVKDELGIADVSEDAYLRRKIDQASALICTFLDIARADDGTVTLGRETLIETISPLSFGAALIPARKPIVSVTSITEDALVDPAGYAVSYGKITRIENSVSLGYWWNSSSPVTIEYVAGWLLPGDGVRNLPVELEHAAIEIVKAARFNRLRDPSLRSEATEGIDSYTLFDRARISDVIAPELAATIGQFRNVYV